MIKERCGKPFYYTVAQIHDMFKLQFEQVNKKRDELIELQRDLIHSILKNEVGKQITLVNNDSNQVIRDINNSSGKMPGRSS